MANISILGEGSWGLGLAILLYNNGHHVKVWSIFPDKIAILNKVRQNETALPGVIIPDAVEFTTDIQETIEGSDVIIMAVASPYTRSTSKMIAPYVKGGQIGRASCRERVLLIV